MTFSLHPINKPTDNRAQILQTQTCKSGAFLAWSSEIWTLGPAQGFRIPHCCPHAHPTQGTSTKSSPITPRTSLVLELSLVSWETTQGMCEEERFFLLFIENDLFNSKSFPLFSWRGDENAYVNKEFWRSAAFYFSPAAYWRAPARIIKNKQSKYARPFQN